eukprot:TRINITY_DN7693_c0_g1_i6.p2 TRINITY_DN7693_c0_g1~~TRINITY_DN7693_c0_g1_i6.p2  ORF type:complete len:218 (+),score=56.33 TRINITY_DN7693_c0_g1_i6:140-793(+)
MQDFSRHVVVVAVDDEIVLEPVDVALVVAVDVKVRLVELELVEDEVFDDVLLVEVDGEDEEVVDEENDELALVLFVELVDDELVGEPVDVKVAVKEDFVIEVVALERVEDLLLVEADVENEKVVDEEDVGLVLKLVVELVDDALVPELVNVELVDDVLDVNVDEEDADLVLELVVEVADVDVGMLHSHLQRMPHHSSAGSIPDCSALSMRSKSLVLS